MALPAALLPGELRQQCRGSPTEVVWGERVAAAIGVERGGRGECGVVCHGRAIVGTILFQDAESTSGCPWYGLPGVASAHQFAVEPLFQGMGLGRRLLDLAERRARETGAREIALDTAEGAAHRIAKCQRRGYRFVDRVQWETTNDRSVVMSKEILR